ncbi:MAG: DUF3306 domain-containing protein [Rhodospirillales bacterium]|nr:DUF3306 domain-containing protein [Rhodospirillales bacterium]
MRRTGETTGGRLSRWSRLKRSGGSGESREDASEDGGVAPAAPYVRQGSAAPVALKESDGLTERGFVKAMAPLADPEEGDTVYEAAPEDAPQNTGALLDADAAALKAFPPRPEDEWDSVDDKAELTPEQEEAMRDLPPIESLTEKSDFQPFFAPNVPDFLKRQAFKALWASSPLFGFRDGLDDYDENFRIIDKLITAADSDYKAGKGYDFEEEDDDLGDGEEDVIAEDEKQVAGTEPESSVDGGDDGGEEDSETGPETAKEPRKSDVRPPDDAV